MQLDEQFIYPTKARFVFEDLHPKMTPRITTAASASLEIPKDDLAERINRAVGTDIQVEILENSVLGWAPPLYAGVSMGPGWATVWVPKIGQGKHWNVASLIHELGHIRRFISHPGVYVDLLVSSHRMRVGMTTEEDDLKIYREEIKAWDAGEPIWRDFFRNDVPFSELQATRWLALSTYRERLKLSANIEK